MVTRYLAPLALVAAFLAVVAVVAGSGGSGSGSGASSATTTSTQSRTSTAQKAKPKKEPGSAKTTQVKPGDTLGAISERTGVSISQLQQLNPDLNPQALTVGQTVKLK